MGHLSPPARLLVVAHPRCVDGVERMQLDIEIDVVGDLPHVACNRAVEKDRIVTVDRHSCSALDEFDNWVTVPGFHNAGPKIRGWTHLKWNLMLNQIGNETRVLH